MSEDKEVLLLRTGLDKSEVAVDYVLEVSGVMRFGIHENLDIKYPKFEERKKKRPELSFFMKKITHGKRYNFTVEKLITRMSTANVSRVFDKVLTEAFETRARLSLELLSRCGFVFYSQHLKEASIDDNTYKLYIKGIVGAKGRADVYLCKQDELSLEDQIRATISEQDRFTILKLASAIDENWGYPYHTEPSKTESTETETETITNTNQQEKHSKS